MIELPRQFLPCVDDWQKLLIICDYLEEAGQVDLAKHCRRTAQLWRDYVGFKRHDLEVGQHVWARFQSQGWSRAVVLNITYRHVLVSFPHRPYRGHQPPIGRRAWWDLEPRGFWQGTQYEKPKPRPTYGAGKNAELAAALTWSAISQVAENSMLIMDRRTTLFPEFYHGNE